MKQRIKLVALSLLSLAFAPPPGFRTANIETGPNPDEQPPPKDSELALLIKGAGVDYRNVMWRIRAGLSPRMAIEAVQQQEFVNELEAFTETVKDKGDAEIREMAKDRGDRRSGPVTSAIAYRDHESRQRQGRLAGPRH